MKSNIGKVLLHVLSNQRRYALQLLQSLLRVDQQLLLRLVQLLDYRNLLDAALVVSVRGFVLDVNSVVAVHEAAEYVHAVEQLGVAALCRLQLVQALERELRVDLVALALVLRLEAHVDVAEEVRGGRLHLFVASCEHDEPEAVDAEQVHRLRRG